MERILLIRTFRSVGTGGPVVPLELLYLASGILQQFRNSVELKIIDLGIRELSLEDIKEQINRFRPQVVILNSLIWEADITHNLTFLAKDFSQETIVIVEGQLPTLAKGYLLQDQNIDYLVVGESDLTVPRLLETLGQNKDLTKVEGIIYRSDWGIVKTEPREYIKNLDDFGIDPLAWDLINTKVYAKYSNWNGSLKERFYVPILTSRGCPFDCTFCCNKKVIGKSFRARSPQSVISEIKFLQEKFGAKEIHVFDPVFNYDVERAKQICRSIVDADIKISLAFPHGLRADLMTDELIDLLKEAGTYKLVYGVETASRRLQEKIKKDLDLDKVSRVIRKTAEKGIIVGGYFMLGFPGESVEEMHQTVNFAVNSQLDLAAFFKVTLHDDVIKLYKSESESPLQTGIFDFQDLGYYSQKRSYADIPAAQLNSMILIAQQEFYLNLGRIKRSFRKNPHKLSFIKNILKAVALILQGYLVRELASDQNIRN